MASEVSASLTGAIGGTSSIFLAIIVALSLYIVHLKCGIQKRAKNGVSTASCIISNRLIMQSLYI